MSDVSLRRLEYFLVVAEELSVTRAARRLHMAQPPLSQQIRKLEDELGCALFVRGSRGLRLTPAGMALAQDAASLLGQVDRVRSRVRAVGGGDVGFLSVGMGEVACRTFATDLLDRFHRVRPGVQLHLREQDTTSLYNGLNSREIDVAVVRMGVGIPGVTILELLEEQPRIALPAGHPLVDRDRLRLADLEREQFILYSRKLGMHHFDEFVSACVEVGGFSPDIVSECDSVGAQLAMIGAGLGIGMVTELSSEVPVPGVAFREVDDLQMRLRFFLAWRADDSDRVLEEFIAVVRQWRDERGRVDRRFAIPTT